MGSPVESKNFYRVSPLKSTVPQEWEVPTDPYDFEGREHQGWAVPTSPCVIVSEEGQEWEVPCCPSVPHGTSVLACSPVGLVTPISPCDLKTSTGDPQPKVEPVEQSVLEWLATLSDIDHAIETQKLVRRSGVHNFEGCRIPVRSKLNIPFLRSELAGYHDSQLIEFLEFGFPLGTVGQPLSNSPGKNHGGALSFPKSIDNYIQKELDKNAIIGPFDASPLEGVTVFSPLSTAEKSDSDERRVIMDLSFPKGASINDHIPKTEYLGAHVRLRYPSIDDLCEIIKVKGRSCALMKRDLSRAFRQFPVDPGQIGLLGFSWRGKIYFDRTLPMGLRSAPLCCQRVTNAVRYMYNNRGFDLVNYVDDLGVAEQWERANLAFDSLGSLLNESGLEEKLVKAVPPNMSMIYLGALADTDSLTLQVSKQRLAELKALLESWLVRRRASKRDFQVIIGKLNFAAACVRQGRVFMSRLISHMKTLPDSGSLAIAEEARKDLSWWHAFLPEYNGISMMPMEGWSHPDEVFATDACLEGCGGWLEGRSFFHSTFPEFILCQDLDINALELLTIIVACKVWGREWRGKRMVVQCDNQVSVIVLNTGRSRAPFLQACLREICFLAARYEFELRATHIAGVSNRIPDLLSRWELEPHAPGKFWELVSLSSPTETFITEDMFKFMHPW